MDNRSRRSTAPRPASWTLLVASVACGTALRPVDPSSRIGERVALGSELVLAEPCTLLPGGTPMGRPDGVRQHRLPPGRYAPLAEDDGGVYFASPGGVLIIEPGLRGARTLPGGIYVPRDPGLDAWEYIGSAEDISSRQRLPGHCRFVLEAAAPADPNTEKPQPAAPGL